MYGFVPSAGRRAGRLGRRRDQGRARRHRRPAARPGQVGSYRIEGGPNPNIEHANRGKRSIGLHMGTPEGREVLYDLARRADVFLTSFLPSARRKFAIDMDDIRAVNPQIIYARGSALGPRGAEAITVGWNAAVAAGVTRAEMDAWALRSHRNAVRAIDEGRFDAEIVPIKTGHGLFSVDEHPRRDTSLEKLASLKPLHPEIEGFSITVGNACGANDGAAALVVASDRLSDRLGLPSRSPLRSRSLLT